MRKNPYGRFLRDKPKEQYISTVSKACLNFFFTKANRRETIS